MEHRDIASIPHACAFSSSIFRLISGQYPTRQNMTFCYGLNKPFSKDRNMSIKRVGAFKGAFRAVEVKWSLWKGASCLGPVDKAAQLSLIGILSV